MVNGGVFVSEGDVLGDEEGNITTERNAKGHHC